MPQFVGDVFGLNSVYEKQVTNVEQNNLANWPEIRFGAYGSPAIYGFFGGGNLSPPTTSSSTVARLDLTTEGTSLGTGSTLLVRSKGVSAVSNHLYGYFAGGSNGNISNLTRLDYSNETLSNPGSGSVIGIRYGMGALSGFSYAYFAGGFFTVPATTFSTIQRFDFINETISNPGKTFTQAKASFSGVLNNLYGYFGGGETASGVFTSVITRLDLVNETTSDPGKNLPLDVSRNASISNDRISYGYFGGGYRGGAPHTSVITRLDFSTENINLPGSNFPTVVRSESATTFNNSYGYFAGGSTGPPLVSVSIVSRLDFSSEVVSNPGTNLPVIRGGHGGVTQLSTVSVFRGSKTYGYFLGGESTPPPTFHSTITRLDFSNETVSNPTKNLLETSSDFSSVANNYYGYNAGGYAFPPVPFSYKNTISRLDFSNETINLPGKNLSLGRSSIASVTSSSYGYFGGGYISGPPGIYFCTIIRLDFSNETVSDPGKNFPSGRSAMASVTGSSYGYFVNGFNTNTPNYINTISRLDFSSETISIPSNSFPSIKNDSKTVSNSSFGYFGGGGASIVSSVISRLDFSNETVSDPGKNLPQSRFYGAATSSSFYGYFAGGNIVFPATTYNTIMRLDFSTENASLSANNLPAARTKLSAVSNSN